MFLLDLHTVINSQKIPEVTPFVLIRSSTAAERLLKEANVRTSSDELEYAHGIFWREKKVMCSGHFPFVRGTPF